MRVLMKLCQLMVLILLISSCANTKEVDFQWLDVTAIPLVQLDHKFKPGDTFRDLALAYIDLKQQCRATNFGVEELQKAQDAIKRLK